MNKKLKLSLVCFAAVSLASCSTLGLDTMSKDMSSADTMSDTASSDMATTEPTATISLKETKSKEIYASIKTTYNNNPQGSVKLQWVAPEGSKCYNTEFAITKYGDKNDVTHATVETHQFKKKCEGTWTANVLFGKDVIASDTIDI